MLVRLLREYLRPYRRPISIVIALQLLSTLATLYLPTLNAQIIDNGVVKGNTGYIERSGAVMLAVSLAQILCSVGAVYFGARTAMSFGRDVRAELFGRVQGFSQREVGRFGTPSLITRTTNDVQQVQMLALMTFTLMVTAPIIGVGAIILALNQNVPLSSLLLILVPLLAVIVVLIISRMRPLFRKMQVRIDRINGVLREQITGVRVIHAFVRDGSETERFADANDDLFAVGLGVGRLMAFMFPSVTLVIQLGSVATLWFGGHLINDGSMQIGSLTAFLSYLVQVLMAVMMATFMFVFVPRAEACAERITEVLDTDSSVVATTAPISITGLKGHLKMTGVEFRYPGAEAAVLNSIDLIAGPGEITTVIGSTGSGKTTLLSLVPRLFDVTAGSVTIDGIDVRQIDEDLLPSLIGLVPQRPYLFSGTVASNLRYGKSDATDEELWRALEIAQARPFVEAMSDGLDSPIAQGGNNVSGGQRQRLAIARAIVHRPRIYLFDDSFSALDYATDATLRAALLTETADATVLIVAQRVSTIRQAKRIVVLDAGRVVGVGTHDELMAGNVTYREIVLSQLTEEEAAWSRPPAGVGERPTPERRGPQGAQGFGPRGLMGGGGPAEKSLDFKSSGLRLLRELSPEHLRVAAILTLGGGSVTLSVLGPRLLGDATNLIFSGVIGRSIPAGASKAQAVAELRKAGKGTLADLLDATHVARGGIDFGHVGQVLLLVLVLYLGSSVAGFFQARLTAMVGQRSVQRLRTKVQSKLARLPLSYFDRVPHGEILSRVTNDIDNISQTLQQTLSQIVTSLLTIVGVLVMMFLISPLLAVIALVTVPLSIFVATRIGKAAQPHFIAQWATTGKLNGHIEEMYTGHALIKVFGQRRAAEATFATHNDALYASSFKAQFISGLIQPTMTFIGNINYVFVAVIGALRVASGQLSLGDVQAFIQYSRQFSQPISQVASMANLLQSGVASAERVFALLDADEQGPDPEGAVALPVVHGSVAFEHVAFSYLPDQPLITDLSLSVEPGQTVAIVGPTGAGKTTLVNLLMRFYEVDSGRITLDGVDIASMTREELRSKTGMVLQDTWLFKGTIAENIAYGSLEASEEAVIAAAKATHVDHFTRTLPDGYGTVLDEEASNVSAGERQLITIARAFLAKPAILILDEATSSVDTRTELLIQRAMNALRVGRTSFVIAHRLSTIRDADLILVMEAGQIVEQGTHEGLLEADGAYARLYAAQFASALSGVE